MRFSPSNICVRSGAISAATKLIMMNARNSARIAFSVFFSLSLIAFSPL